jgi:hypothetical protein
MRSTILSLGAVLLPLAVSACNDPFSNDDILFLKSLPSRRQLEVDVPSGGAPDGGTSRSGLRVEDDAPPTPSKYYHDAVDAAAKLNEGIDKVLSIVEAAEKVPPTQRDLEGDQRIWGPFLGDHEAYYTIAIHRVRTSTTIKWTSTSTHAEVSVYFEFTVTAFPKAEPKNVITLIAGRYAPEGANISQGQGQLFLNFEGGRVINSSSSDRGLLLVTYDNRFGQKTVEAALDTSGDYSHPFKMISTGTHFELQTSGLTKFEFIAVGDVIMSPAMQNETVVVITQFAPDRHGRADAVITGGDVGVGVYIYDVECWDTSFNRTYETTNIPGQPPLIGMQSNCMEFQKSPFEK